MPVVRDENTPLCPTDFRVWMLEQLDPCTVKRVMCNCRARIVIYVPTDYVVNIPPFSRSNCVYCSQWLLPVDMWHFRSLMSIPETGILNNKQTTFYFIIKPYSTRKHDPQVMGSHFVKWPPFLPWD